jgi:hypothetical protein
VEVPHVQGIVVGIVECGGWIVWLGQLLLVFLFSRDGALLASRVEAFADLAVVDFYLTHRAQVDRHSTFVVVARSDLPVLSFPE